MKEALLKFYRWFTPTWLTYVFEKKRWDNHNSYWTIIKCRIAGHPRGEVYYNPGGSEPNHHCADCGDIIG